MAIELSTLGQVIYDAVKSRLTTAWEANRNAGGFRLTNQGAPVDANDGARKAEVDAVATVATLASSDAADALEAADDAALAAGTAQTTATSAQASATQALARAMPAGGDNGQVLTKVSDDDYDAEWTNAGSGDVPSSRTIAAGTGLTGGGSLAADRTLALDFGTGATQVRPGNDAVHTNARTPTTHATSHQNGGSDEISVAGLSGVLADAQRADTVVATGGDLTVGAIGDGEMLVRSGSTIVSAAIPTGDITSVSAGTGLSGGGNSGAVTLNVTYGTSAGTAAQGNDTRFLTLSDATPTTITGPGTPSAPGDSTEVSRANHSHTHGSQGGGVAHVLASTGVHGFMAHQESTKLSGIEPGANAVAAGTGLTSTGTGSITLAADFGSVAGKVTEGNDSRLTNDRTASGLRSATTVVVVSAATAPSAGQHLIATSSTAAAWADSPSEIQATLHSDLSVTTSSATFATLTLPQAGTYRFRLIARILQTSATGFSTMSFSAAHSGLVEILGSWSRAKHVYTVDIGTHYGGTTFLSSRGAASGERQSVEFTGHVIVNAAGTLTISVILDAGTGLCRPGSTVAALYASSGTTAQGYANSISVTSGQGYAGSVLTATGAAQWTADGVNISGQTGSTYTVTRDVEGKIIRCGASNPIQMWSPVHLPTVFKTDGTNYGGWWDPSNAASVTLNSGNIASLANLFTGGQALVQANGSDQPAYTSGTIDLNGSQKGLAGTNLIFCDIFAIMRYATGVETTFSGNKRLAGATGRDIAIGVNTNSYLFGTGVSTYWPSLYGDTMPLNVYGMGNFLPMPKSLIEFRMGRTATLSGGVGWASSAGDGWNGPIWEIVQLAKAADGPTRTRVEGYLMWHNNIPTQLPPDHPFYNAPPRIY